MTTLNLTLQGLCGLVPNEFVPEQPGARPHRISRMRVLVLDAAHLGAQQGLNLCPHRPRMIIGRGANAQSFDLNQHNIEIEGLATGQSIRLLSDFWKVARMNQVTKTPFAVDDGFFRNPPITGLVASLQLTAGDVQGIDTAPRELDFQNDAQAPYKANFARAVHFALTLTGPGKIRLRRFGPTDPEPPIDLVPDANDSVDVTLTNLCDLEEDAAGREDESIDFTTFYSLLPSYRGPRFVPVDVTAKLRAEVLAEATNIGAGCIPTTFDAHPDA